MMTELDELPLSTSAYLADTGHLTTLEHGAYLLLLIAMRRSADGWLPGTDQYLARATRMTLGRWKRVAPTIRAMLVTDGDNVSQKRILRERSESNQDQKSIPGENPNPQPKSLKNKDSSSELVEAPSLLLESSKDLEGKKESEGRVQPTRGGRYRRTGVRSQMPKDWVPSDYGRLYARSKNFDDVKISQMARACLLYHRKHGTLIADFDATWESWVDREISFAAQAKQKSGGPSMYEIATGQHGGENR